MTLEINGATRVVPDLRDVAQLVVHLDLPAAALLVEHNGTALRRDEWEGVPLADGDRLEILRIAAGG